jgi:hypothetical protein
MLVEEWRQSSLASDIFLYFLPSLLFILAQLL